jgi:flagellar basal-body rod protein FlgG
MGSLIDAATVIMANATRRIDVVATNIANLNTPGFKTVGLARRATNGPPADFANQLELVRNQLDQGKMISTGRTFDLAVMGQGYLAVRQGDIVSYIRNGQFTRTDENLLVSPEGAVLQNANGGDLIVGQQVPEILEDGTVIEEGRATGRIGLYTAAPSETAYSSDGANFDLGRAPVAANRAGVRQGFLEASNVDTGAQMIAMMASLRESEAGAKLIQTYDELLGKAFSTLGQVAR